MFKKAINKFKIEPINYKITPSNFDYFNNIECPICGHIERVLFIDKNYQCKCQHSHIAKRKRIKKILATCVGVVILLLIQHYTNIFPNIVEYIKKDMADLEPNQLMYTVMFSVLFTLVGTTVTGF